MKAVNKVLGKVICKDGLYYRDNTNNDPVSEWGNLITATIFPLDCKNIEDCFSPWSWKYKKSSFNEAHFIFVSKTITTEVRITTI